ncbi:hypothetical protein V6Z12_A11G143000, partial [Gossypium hirsutum]
MQSNSEQVLFGLRFSSLTMLKQNSVGLRMGQVSKIVEVEGLEIYCSICKDAAKDLSLSNTGGSESWFNSRSVGDKSEHIVEPFNVSLSLLALNSKKMIGKASLHNGLYILPTSPKIEISKSFTALGKVDTVMLWHF